MSLMSRVPQVHQLRWSWLVNPASRCLRRMWRQRGLQLLPRSRRGPEVTDVDWGLSVHAKQRASDMEIEDDEVLAVLAAPECDYPSNRPGCRVATSGLLAVPYNPESRTAITVLWNRCRARADIDRAAGVSAVQGSQRRVH